MCGKGSTTTTSTSAPNPQAMGAYSDLLNRASGVASLPFQQYGGEFVAPINQQQQAGIGNINQNAGFAQPFIQQAAGYANQAAQPISGSQINQYLSPYTQDVVNATESQFNQQNQVQQNQLTGNAAAQGALGGDRVGVAQAALAGQQQLSEAPTIAGLYNQGYSQALGEANTEQQAMANAAYSLGNLGVAGQNAALTGANAQLGAGTLEQSTQQAQDQALYNQFLAQQGFPYQQTQWLAGIDTGVGSQMGGTSSTTAPPPNATAQWIGAGLGLLAMSDRRAKEDVHKIGKTNDGQPIYRYRYKGSPHWQIGLMAQDVEKRHPEAVAGFGGLKFVDLKTATENSIRRDAGGRIQGFDLGGTPYAGGSSYIPTMGLTPGRGAPNAPGAPRQNQTDPLKQAMEAENFIKGMKGSGGSGGNSGFGSLFGGGDPSMDEVTQAGAEAGLSPEELGFGAGGEDLLAGGVGAGAGADMGMADLGALAFARRGGRIAGFAMGGYADGGGEDSFDDSFNAFRSQPERLERQLMLGDLVGSPPTGPYDIGSADMPIMAPGQELPAPMRTNINPAPSGKIPDQYVNPLNVNGQPQNLTGDIIPPGGTGGDPAPSLAPATDVPSRPVAGVGQAPMNYAPSPDLSGGQAAEAPSDKQSGFGGLLGMLNNPLHLDPSMRKALLAAGFGMLASRSPNLGNAIGEGALTGLSAYSGAQKEEFNEKQAVDKLHQSAKQASDKLALETKKQQSLEEYREFLKKKSEEQLHKPPTGMQFNDKHELEPIPGYAESAATIEKAKKGTTTLPPEAWSKHGDEFLAYLPDDKQALVRGVVDYSIDPKSLPSRSNDRMDAMIWAKQYDPDFDQKTYNQRYQAIQRFTTGKQGDTVRSLNVAIDHLGTLEQLGNALNNNDVQGVNRISNYLTTQFGTPAVTNFNLAKQVVADEVLKAVVGSGAGSQSDREGLQAQFSAANSPAQLVGAIHTAQKLMAGQVVGLKQQYEFSTGSHNFDRMLTPAARQALTGMGGAAPAATGGGGGGDPLAAARDAITRGAPRDAVIQRLRQNGIDPTGL